MNKAVYPISFSRRTHQYTTAFSRVLTWTRLFTSESVTKSLWDKQLFSKPPITQKTYERVFPQAECENSFIQSYFEMLYHRSIIVI